MNQISKKDQIRYLVENTPWETVYDKGYYLRFNAKEPGMRMEIVKEQYLVEGFLTQMRNKIKEKLTLRIDFGYTGGFCCLHLGDCSLFPNRYVRWFNKKIKQKRRESERREVERLEKRDQELINMATAAIIVENKK